jgi:putative transcriptional regulator
MSDQSTSKATDDRPGEKDKYGMTAEDWAAFDAKTDDDIAADVASDPDAARLATADRPSRARHLALAKLVRQKLRLSREDFAASYGIPLDMLTAWERHEAKPSPVEEAYLKLIERAPEAAKVALPVAAK